MTRSTPDVNQGSNSGTGGEAGLGRGWWGSRGEKDMEMPGVMEVTQEHGEGVHVV